MRQVAQRKTRSRWAIRAKGKPNRIMLQWFSLLVTNAWTRAAAGQRTREPSTAEAGSSRSERIGWWARIVVLSIWYIDRKLTDLMVSSKWIKLWPYGLWKKSDSKSIDKQFFISNSVVRLCVFPCVYMIVFLLHNLDLLARVLKSQRSSSAGHDTSVVSFLPSRNHIRSYHCTLSNNIKLLYLNNKTSVVNTYWSNYISPKIKHL